MPSEDPFSAPRASRQRSSKNQPHESLEIPRAMANTKSITDTEERKKLKRAARKAAAPKAKRTGARGENKQKIKKAARGAAKR